MKKGYEIGKDESGLGGCGVKRCAFQLLIITYVYHNLQSWYYMHILRWKSEILSY
jgi:hypothetical protein